MCIFSKSLPARLRAHIDKQLTWAVKVTSDVFLWQLENEVITEVQQFAVDL